MRNICPSDPMRSNIDSANSLCFVLFPLCVRPKVVHTTRTIFSARNAYALSARSWKSLWVPRTQSFGILGRLHVSGNKILEILEGMLWNLSIAWESPFFGRPGLGVCSHLSPSETLSLLGISWKLWERWRLWGLGNLGNGKLAETIWNQSLPRSVL